MKVSSLEIVEAKNAVRELVEGWRYSPIDILRQHGVYPAYQHWERETELTLADQGSFFLALRDKSGLLQAGVLFEHARWEEMLLGMQMGTIKHVFVKEGSNINSQKLGKFLRVAVEKSKNQGCRFLSIKLSTQNVLATHSVENLGFRLMDTVLDFVVDLQDFALEVMPNTTTEQAGTADLVELVDLMDLSFANHFGRFNSDPKLREHASSIYRAWIESSINGYADFVLKAVIDKEIAGTSVWKLPSPSEIKSGISLAHFSIGAVHPKHFGKGVFNSLTLAGMLLMKDLGIRFIEGPTHINNHGIHRSYQQLGWKILGARNTFHLWM